MSNSNIVCTECKKRPPSVGRKKCDVCRASQSRRMKERRKRLKEQGLCTICGRAPAVAGRAKCLECQQKQNEAVRLYNHRKAAITQVKSENCLQECIAAGVEAMQSELDILIAMRDVVADKFLGYASNTSANNDVLKQGMTLITKFCRGVRRQSNICQVVRESEHLDTRDLELVRKENTRVRVRCQFAVDMARGYVPRGW